MSEEQIQQLLSESKAFGGCVTCGHFLEDCPDPDESEELTCKTCPTPCPCRTCSSENNHAGWEWRGTWKEKGGS